MTDRSDAFRRIAQGKPRPDPDAVRVRQSIQAITALPDWAVLVEYLEHAENQKSAQSDQLNDGGALLRAASRRSLIRELKGLRERVIDDGPSDQNG